MAEAQAGKALRTSVREDPRRRLRDNDGPDPRMLTAARANGSPWRNLSSSPNKAQRLSGPGTPLPTGTGLARQATV